MLKQIKIFVLFQKEKNYFLVTVRRTLKRKKIVLIILTLLKKLLHTALQTCKYHR